MGFTNDARISMTIEEVRTTFAVIRKLKKTILLSANSPSTIFAGL